MANIDPFLEEKTNHRPPLVDYYRIVALSIRWWYYIIVFLVVTLLLAFFKNRYTQRIYPVSMSILIKESEESGNTAELLYNNPIINSYRNFYNEPYILKSYPLIQSVINDLNFMVFVYKEGRFKTTELYKGLPFNIYVVGKNNASIKGGVFSLTILNDSQYKLERLNGEYEKVGSPFIFKFNESNALPNDSITISVGSKTALHSLIGEKYLIKLVNSYSVAVGYSSSLKVDWAEKGASVLNLTITGPVAQKNIDFLNKLYENYSELDLRKKRRAAENSLLFIDEQLDQIKDSLFIFENEMEEFKNTNVVTDLSGEALRILEKLETLNEAKVEITIQEKYFDYLEELIKKDTNFDKLILPSIAGIKDPVLIGLINQLAELQIEYEAIGNYNVNPMIGSQKQAVKEITASVLESITSLRKTHEIAKKQLNEEIDQYESKLRRLPKAERTLVALQRNYRLSESLFTFLMQKRAEAGISKASASTDIEIINRAYVSGGSTQPQVRKNYMMAVFVGLGLPLGIIVLIIAFNNKVQSKSDIEALTQIPILGAVGHNSSEENIVVAHKPKSAISESFRALRSNLNYFTQTNGNGTGGKVFVVTSSISGEGKTFTTMNLATVFAYSGKKTLIIGGDMRRPRMYGDFGLVNDIGMSTIISEGCKWEDAVQKTLIDNLDFIAAGPVPPNPSELLMKSNTKDLIIELKKHYDFILIDSPPVALVTDAFILSELAEHTIYITRQNHTPKEALTNINEYYVSHKITHISIVFNDIANNRIGYGYGAGYGYGYGYGYGHSYGAGYYDEDKPAKSKRRQKKS